MPSSVLLSLKKCPQILDSYRQCVERRPQDHEVRYFFLQCNRALVAYTVPEHGCQSQLSMYYLGQLRQA
jgi:hypothetical protein